MKTTKKIKTTYNSDLHKMNDKLMKAEEIIGIVVTIIGIIAFLIVVAPLMK